MKSQESSNDDLELKEFPLTNGNVPNFTIPFIQRVLVETSRPVPIWIQFYIFEISSGSTFSVKRSPHIGIRRKKVEKTDEYRISHYRDEFFGKGEKTEMKQTKK